MVQIQGRVSVSTAWRMVSRTACASSIGIIPIATAPAAVVNLTVATPRRRSNIDCVTWTLFVLWSSACSVADEITRRELASSSWSPQRKLATPTRLVSHTYGTAQNANSDHQPTSMNSAPVNTRQMSVVFRAARKTSAG